MLWRRLLTFATLKDLSVGAFATFLIVVPVLAAGAVVLLRRAAFVVLPD
jgi:hypothetical protein